MAGLFSFEPAIFGSAYCTKMLNSFDANQSELSGSIDFKMCVFALKLIRFDFSMYANPMFLVEPGHLI